MFDYLLQQILRELGAEGTADIALLNEEEMRALNRDTRGIDSATDVLSFPNLVVRAGDIPRAADYPLDTDDDELFLGDIALCMPIIENQARERNCVTSNEMLVMLIHSVLHLLGYDHESDADAEVMRGEEERLALALKQLFVVAEMREQARQAAANAYAPYSSFAVGAAILAGDTIYRGCNVENLSFGATICAERSAATAAVTAGQQRFDAVFVYHDGEAMPSPCGMCLQFLSEFCHGEVAVYVEGGGEVRRQTLSELLPNRFCAQLNKAGEREQ